MKKDLLKSLIAILLFAVWLASIIYLISDSKLPPGEGEELTITKNSDLSGPTVEYDGRKYTCVYNPISPYLMLVERRGDIVKVLHVMKFSRELPGELGLFHEGEIFRVYWKGEELYETKIFPEWSLTNDVQHVLDTRDSIRNFPGDRLIVFSRTGDLLITQVHGSWVSFLLYPDGTSNLVHADRKTYIERDTWVKYWSSTQNSLNLLTFHRF